MENLIREECTTCQLLPWCNHPEYGPDVQKACAKCHDLTKKSESKN